MFQLRPVEKSEIRVLYAHMKRDFPRNERPPYVMIRRMILKRIYDALFLSDSKSIAGYAVVTAPDALSYVLINFLATLPEQRGRGVGTALLALLARRYAGRALILEVEDPEAAADESERDLRTRRIRFYERSRFALVPTARCRIFGVDMRIMANAPLDPHTVRQTLHSLYRPAFASEKWLRFIDVENVI